MANSDFLPYFKMYPRDWITSPTVMLMSLEEQGAYFRMLCLQWAEGSVEKRHLRGFLHMTEEQVEALLAGPVGECFEVCEDGHLRNARLQEEREEAGALIEKRRMAGRARGKHKQASATQVPVKAEAQAEAQAKPRKRRNAGDEFLAAVDQWERFNGPMPSRLREAMIEYGKVRKVTNMGMWPREMWQRNLDSKYSPEEWAYAYEEAARCAYKAPHPKKGVTQGPASSGAGASAPRNGFKDLLEEGS